MGRGVYKVGNVVRVGENVGRGWEVEEEGRFIRRGGRRKVVGV